MKKVIELSLILLIFGGCVVKNDEQESVYWNKKKTIKYWNGQSINEFEGKQMAAMLWLRPKISENQGDFPAKHQIYKRFDDSDYMLFLEILKNPENPLPMDVGPANEILYLSFLDGSQYVICFTFSQKYIQVRNGYSERLYDIFTQKIVNSTYDIDKDTGLTIAPNLRAPSPEHRYRDDWIDANVMEGAQKRQNHD